jgi:phosphoribosylanthranilate isomerase
MTFVKICGITNFEDAKVAADAGADYLGFIFYEKSPRKADPEVAAWIMQAFEGETRYKMLVGVGVFVSPAADQVKHTLSICGLKAAQVHRLNRDELIEMRKAAYGAVYSAVQPRTLDEALATLDLVDRSRDDSVYKVPGWCPQLLMDAYHPELAGGTGHRADFKIAREITQRVPRLVLAGGLTPDNIAEAIRAVRPYAVDVASGVEQSPGKKDHGKVRAFIQAVREVEKEISR